MWIFTTETNGVKKQSCNKTFKKYALHYMRKAISNQYNRIEEIAMNNPVWEITKLDVKDLDDICTFHIEYICHIPKEGSNINGKKFSDEIIFRLEEV